MSSRYYVGEKVTLRFSVENLEGRDFEIRNAEYMVKIGDVIQSSGAMMIEEHEISFIFQPTAPGNYTIIIWYEINNDRRRGSFIVEVVE